GLATSARSGCQDEDGGSPDNVGVQTTPGPPGEHCEAGGTRLDISQDEATSTVYLCHGRDGDEISVTEAGDRCRHGGSLIQVGDATPVLVCRGENGQSDVQIGRASCRERVESAVVGGGCKRQRWRETNT